MRMVPELAARAHDNSTGSEPPSASRDCVLALYTRNRRGTKVSHRSRHSLTMAGYLSGTGFERGERRLGGSTKAAVCQSQLGGHLLLGRFRRTRTTLAAGLRPGRFDRYGEDPEIVAANDDQHLVYAPVLRSVSTDSQKARRRRRSCCHGQLRFSREHPGGDQGRWPKRSICRVRAHCSRRGSFTGSSRSPPKDCPRRCLSGGGCTAPLID